MDRLVRWIQYGNYYYYIGDNMKFKKENEPHHKMMSSPHMTRKQKGKQNDRQRGKWFILSRRYRAANPICEMEGCRRVSVEAHHIIPYNEDPSKELRWDNLMALCHGCHDKIHNRHIDRDLDHKTLI